MPDRATSLPFAACSFIVLALVGCGSDSADPSDELADAALDGAAEDSGAPEDAGRDAAALSCADGVDLEGGGELWPGFCVKHIDDGADGHVDRVWSYEYDAEGRTVRFVVGEPPTGSQKRWIYDERGNLLREEHDTGIDDTWEVSIERTYDAAGNLLTEATDENGDGKPDRSLSNTYECFAGAAETALPGACTTDIDLDADGVIELIQARVYDDDERLLTVTERHAEHANIITRVTRHTYDSRGDRIRTEIDVAADGILEALIEREHDRDHHLLSVRSDHDADGSIELQHDYVYDEAGALVREDKQINGVPVYRFEYEIDERGLVARETETFFIAPEHDAELRRYHDAAGNPVLEISRLLTSEQPDSCIRYEYGCFE